MAIIVNGADIRNLPEWNTNFKLNTPDEVKLFVKSNNTKGFTYLREYWVILARKISHYVKNRVWITEEKVISFIEKTYKNSYSVISSNSRQYPASQRLRSYVLNIFTGTVLDKKIENVLPPVTKPVDPPKGPKPKTYPPQKPNKSEDPKRLEDPKDPKKSKGGEQPKIKDETVKNPEMDKKANPSVDNEKIVEPVNNEPVFIIENPEYYLDDILNQLLSYIENQGYDQKNLEYSQLKITTAFSSAFEFSGIQDVKDLQIRKAVAIGLIAEAMKDEIDGVRISKAIANVIDRVLAASTTKKGNTPGLTEPTRAIAKDLILYMLDPKQDHLTDEDRLLCALRFIDSWTSMHFYTGKDEELCTKYLTKELNTIKYLEKDNNFFKNIGKAVGAGIANVAFTWLKDRTINEITSYEALKTKKTEIGKVMDELVPLAQIILWDNRDDPCPVKKKVRDASAKYANKDFKEILNFDVYNHPTPHEMANRLITTCKNLIQYLDEA